MNRVRCRQTVDAQGNCKPTDVYLLLPRVKQAKTILKYIERAMPYLQVEFDFDYKAIKRGVRKSDREGGLCTFLKNRPTGEYLKKDICKRKAMSPATFERLVAKAKDDPTSELAKVMLENNISYHVTGKGRASKAYFLKQ